MNNAVQYILVCNDVITRYNERKAAGGVDTEPLLSGWFKMLSAKAGSAWYELAAPDEVAQGHTGAVGTSKSIRQKSAMFGGSPTKPTSPPAAAAAGGGARGGWGRKGTAPARQESRIPSHNVSVATRAEMESLDDYKLTKTLGAGSFGRVFLAENKRNKQTYAIKSLKKVNVIEGEDVDNTMAERRILSLGADADCPFITGQCNSSMTHPLLFFFGSTRGHSINVPFRGR